MGEKRFRNKVNWFVFFFSILVIRVHSYNAELFLGRTQEAAALDRMERFLGERIGQIAVPGFFMISGYLFYRNFTMDKLWKKWGSRIGSILIPYLLWNGIYYIGYVVGSRLPFVGEIVGKGEVPFGLAQLTDAVLYHRYHYVFWYLYQLIMLVALAPVLYPLLKRKLLARAAFVLMLVGIGMNVSLPALNLDALFYYSAAVYLAIHEKRLVERGWNLKRGLAGLCMICGGVFLEQGGLVMLPFHALFSVLFRLLVPMGLWLLVPEGCLPQAKGWARNNFFIYAVHFAMVRLINKTVAALFSGIFAVPLILYLMMPVIITVISYGLARLMERKMPSVWKILTGGRGM